MQHYGQRERTEGKPGSRVWMSSASSGLIGVRVTSRAEGLWHWLAAAAAHKAPRFGPQSGLAESPLGEPPQAAVRRKTRGGDDPR